MRRVEAEVPLPYPTVELDGFGFHAVRLRPPPVEAVETVLGADVEEKGEGRDEPRGSESVQLIDPRRVEPSRKPLVG